MLRSLSFNTALLMITMASSASAGETVPAGLAAFRQHCRAPDAKLTLDTASLEPRYTGGRDLPFHEEGVRSRIDDILYVIGAACDPEDRMGVEWKVADKIIESKAGHGTRYERPERLVPVERFAGVREVRVVFDTRAEARAAFVAGGGDHRDWLKKVFSHVDKRLLEEDMVNIMAVSGMPPAITLTGGVLTVGLAPETQIDSGLERLFVRAVDLALAGTKAKGEAKPAQR